MPNTNLTNLQ